MWLPSNEFCVSYIEINQGLELLDGYQSAIAEDCIMDVSFLCERRISFTVHNDHQHLPTNLFIQFSQTK